ncbi:MAG: hypothetical protein AB7O60_05945 [Variibacter sp.]
MPRFLNSLFEAGRTSFARGCAGLLSTSLLVFLLIPVPIFAAILWDDLLQGSKSALQIASAVKLLGYSYFVVLSIVVIVGVPVWAALRLLGRESVRAYAIAGCIGAVLARLHFAHVRLGALGPCQMIMLAIGVFGGGIASLTFWLIARMPIPTEAKLLFTKDGRH